MTARSSRTSSPATGSGAEAAGGGRNGKPASRRVTRPARSAPDSAPAVTSCQTAFQQAASVSGSPVFIAASASASRLAGSNAIRA